MVEWVTIGRAPVQVRQFACPCSAQSEGMGEPPACWKCGTQMRQWGTRLAEYAPFEIDADRADTRTANGGF